MIRMRLIQNTEDLCSSAFIQYEPKAFREKSDVSGEISTQIEARTKSGFKREAENSGMKHLMEESEAFEARIGTC